MTLFQYVVVFGSILDQNPENKTFKKRIPFKLWPRQVECCNFIEKEQITLLPKSRQKGLSEIAAERALFTLFKNENIEGVAISISEDVAKYFLERRVLTKFQELNKNFPGMFPQIVGAPTKDKIVWEGNRVINSIASSNTAAASRTLDFLIIDEAGGIDENRGKLGEANSIFKPILTNSMPALNQNSSAWAMIIGTSVPGSYYNQLVREAYESKNTTHIKYFFIGWWHQPGRDKAWYRREKEVQNDDMPLQHPTDMEDFFYIKDGLVFKHLDHREGGRHIVDFTIGTEIRRKLDEEIERFKPSWNNDFITAYDHGTNHPAVNLYGLYDHYKDILFIFDETFFQEGHGKDVKEINDEINKKMKKFPRKPDREVADGAIYNDIGVESVGSRFRKERRNFKKAKKHDESASRDLLSSRFRDNTIFINPRCRNLIKQLKDYRWDAKSKGEKPIQKDDDAIDALRYLCSECKTTDFKPKQDLPSAYQVSYEERKLKNRDSNYGNLSWEAF